jgi:hypothetical protein
VAGVRQEYGRSTPYDVLQLPVCCFLTRPLQLPHELHVSLDMLEGVLVMWVITAVDKVGPPVCFQTQPHVPPVACLRC